MITTVAVVVRDYDEAIAFYVDVLGLDLIEDTALNASKRWVVVGRAGGARLLLARAATPDQETRIGDQTGGRVFLFMETDDFACDHAAYVANGVRFVEGPRIDTYGTVAVFEDLYGNRWDLIGRAPSRRRIAALTSAAPVFSTPAVRAWLAHYRALGFDVEAHDDSYGFASRDSIELHVSHDRAHDPLTTAGCAYVSVDDADALYEEWSSVGAGRTVAPVDTDYGIREGAHIDLDGNLIRFGSRLQGS